MMSTVHPAVYVEVKKKYSDEKIMKPLAVYDYTQRMVGVDKHDQFNTYYNPPRRSLKWTTKMSLHLLSMCMTNAYVSLRLRMQNAVPAQPCVGKLRISLVLLNFLHCNFRLWFKTP